MNRTFAISLAVLGILILLLFLCNFFLLIPYAKEPTLEQVVPVKGPEYIPPMVTYFLTSSVGYRINPMGGTEEGFHRGVDLVAPPGSKVFAVADGIIVEHWPPPGTKSSKGFTFEGHSIFGGYVIIQHHNGTFSCYGHLATTRVHTHDKVLQGQEIGTQGSTGNATGPHLHFELIVNPLSYLETP